MTNVSASQQTTAHKLPIKSKFITRAGGGE